MTYPGPDNYPGPDAFPGADIYTGSSIDIGTPLPPSSYRTGWECFSRDASLAQDDELPIVALTVVTKHLEVSTGLLTTPFTVTAYGQTGPGRGVIVRRNGVDILTGPVVSQELGWDEATGRVVIKLQILGDETRLARRIVFPDPTRAGDAQTTVDYWTWPTGAVVVQSLKVQAARLIRDRFVSGQSIFEDFTWWGYPVLVGEWNDEIAAGFYAANPGTDFPANRALAIAYLNGFISANTPTGTPSVASTAMLALIDAQAGPSALYANRITGLYLGADPGVGIAQAWAFRYDNLLDALAQMSVRSGLNLGVRLASTPDGLQASVYVPRDLSREVRFSAEIGNLTGLTYTRTAPTVTTAVAAGGGDLRGRLQQQVVSTDTGDAAWGLPGWSYVDRRDTTDTTELIKSANDAVTEGVGTTSITLTLSDTDAIRFGVDWGPYPGDQVTVEVGLPDTGVITTITDIVRQIRFDVDENGAELIRPAVGTPDAAVGPPSLTRTQLAVIGDRLTLLERRK